MTEKYLHLELAGYWHSGSGRSAGTHLDALTEKDQYGLPFVAGKQLKGLIRHALHRAELWQWNDHPPSKEPSVDIETLLFGSRSQTESRHAGEPGMLIVSDAQLGHTERSYLKENKGLATHLYQAIYSTSIGESGSAVDGSLRGIEVCAPVSLTCFLQLAVTSVDDIHRAEQQAWLSQKDPWQWLATCLPLIDAIGAHRTRGLGEVTLSLSNTSKGVLL